MQLNHVNMKQLVFNKIKTTDGFLFKREKNRVTIEGNSITISSLPFLFFSGKYFIHSVEKDNRVCTVFKAVKADNKEIEPNFDKLLFDEWHIYITKSGNKVMLYNNSREGIILKA
tara:strand:+ start:1790 stop:2134 length:345 start_codon:yes stop_codon:yes gene_type:complete